MQANTSSQTRSVAVRASLRRRRSTTWRSTSTSHSNQWTPTENKWERHMSFTRPTSDYLSWKATHCYLWQRWHVKQMKSNNNLSHTVLQTEYTEHRCSEWGAAHTLTHRMRVTSTSMKIATDERSSARQSRHVVNKPKANGMDYKWDCISDDSTGEPHTQASTYRLCNEPTRIFRYNNCWNLYNPMFVHDFVCPMTCARLYMYALMHAFECTSDLLYKPVVHSASDVIFIQRPAWVHLYFLAHSWLIDWS